MNTCAISGLSQVINKPMRICLKNDGKRVVTCIDNIYLNTPEVCPKSISLPIGYTDHNLIAIVRKRKVQKADSKIIKKRTFKNFDHDKYVREVTNANWSNVFLQDDPEEAFQAFKETLMIIVDNHAPLKKFTVRTVNSPWLDKELKEHMIERDQAKSMTISSGLKSDWQVYCKLRNFVTKLKKKKKKQYYVHIIYEIKHDSKQLWSMLNYLLKGNKSIPSFLETGGEFLSKPNDIANHLNNYFINKIDMLKNTVQHKNKDLSVRLIDQIMQGKDCIFEFKNVSVLKIKLMLIAKMSDLGLMILTEGCLSLLLQLLLHWSHILLINRLFCFVLF